MGGAMIPSERASAAPIHHQARDHARPHAAVRARVDFAAVNRAALAVCPLVLGRILPGGKRDGQEYIAFNPRRADRHLGSLSTCEAVNGQTSRQATGAAI
jgi:hypothetical protein